MIDKLTTRGRAYKLEQYEPFPKQRRFHVSDCSIRAVFGGNRSGKTTCGGNEFLMHMTGVYPSWYPQELRYPKDQGLKGRIIATDFLKGVGEVIIPFIEEWIDASVGGHFIKERKRNPMGIPIKWILKNGRVFDILTHEQKTDQFEGWSGDLAWFDEPPPKDKYTATLRGLVDRKGRAWLTLTPLNQPWLYDELYEANDKRIFVETMDISENPTLSTEYITEVFSRAMDENEREARLHGKFRHLSGLVYKEFDQDVHVCAPPKVEGHWSKFFAIDPHPRTPTACLWVAVDEKDTLWVYDELWLEGMSLSEIAMAIKSQEGTMKVDRRLIDPAMDKTDYLVGGLNVRKEFMKHGIYCSRANNDFTLGLSRVRETLRPQYSHLLGKSIPRLRISRQCSHLIYEFTHYLWDEYSMRPEDHDGKQKPKKKNDHFLDCFRYIMNDTPRFRRLEEDDNTDVVYDGEYVKYPSNRDRNTKGSTYHDLVER